VDAKRLYSAVVSPDALAKIILAKIKEAGRWQELAKNRSGGGPPGIKDG